MYKHLHFSLIFLACTTCSFASQAEVMPLDFVYLSDIAPSILQDMKYASSDNFIGKPVKGYQTSRCILTREAAEALAKLQKALQKKSLGLKVYDCYRPADAVGNFITWSHDLNDQKQKTYYYPHVNKASFFKLGYVAEKSGHSRGSTVDLTIIYHHSELKMGTHFDFMDPKSHSLSHKITREAQKNRLVLRNAMIHAGFKPLKEEWWHFTLQNEPFPNTYFNFPVR